MAEFLGINGRTRGFLAIGLGVPTINWNHPLSKKLVACYVPQYYPSGTIKNIATPGQGDMTTRTGGNGLGHPTPLGLTSTPEGYGLGLGDGANPGFAVNTFGATPTAWQLTSGQSLFFRGFRTGQFVNTGTVYVFGTACSSTPFNCYVIGGGTGTGPYQLFYNTTSAAYTGSIAPATNTLVSIGATFASGAAAKLYVNGVNDPLGGSPPNVNITYAGTVSTYIGQSNPATRPINHTVTIAYIWMRPLSVGEHRYLSNNPYTLLQWPADMVYNAQTAPAAAPGTPEPTNKSIFWSPLTVGLGGAAVAERWLRRRKATIRRLRGE